MRIVNELPHARSRILGLDAMRSAAILLVMFSHWSNNILYWFGIHPNDHVFFSGDLGVAVFFALSGFLIGQILIEQTLTNPDIQSLTIFLQRRWMRTLPLYFMVLVVLVFAFPPDKDRVQYAITFATMTQNLITPMPGWPWWYSVSWSLTIEEWFYILFGCAAFAAARVFHKGWAIWVPVLAFLTGPLLLRLLIPEFRNPAAGLTLTVPFRLDEIAYGVAMAQLYATRSPIFRYPAACLITGCVLIAAAWSGYTCLPASLAPVFIYNVTMLGCALLIPAALCIRTAPRWFTLPATMISAQSYGLYLLHETILVDVAQNLWDRHLVPVWGCVGIAVIVPFILSYLSFKFFEAPILRWRPTAVRQAALPSHPPSPYPTDRYESRLP